MRFISTRWVTRGLWILLVGSLAFAEQTGVASGKVTLWRVPDGGLQPQLAVDRAGVLHLVYLGGTPGAADIFYVRRGPADDGFSQPIRVNSTPGTAIATGTVRGAHLALGKNGRVHVAWMGSQNAESAGPDNARPMLYARMNDDKTGFDPQRNVLQFAVGLDGGGSIAADESGNVYVAWHGRGAVEGEANRRVWLTRSKDEGRSFLREAAAFSEPTGACGCCGMRAFADHRGALYLMYRAATGGVNRDMFLLTSKDAGVSFQGGRIHPWKLNACPMSTVFLTEDDSGVLAAWETAGQVYFTQIDPTIPAGVSPTAPPGNGGGRRHPVIAGGKRGERILVWTEGTAWQKGGSVAWQVFDHAGNPTETKGTAPGVPVWGLAAVVARPGVGFTIIY